MLHFPQGLSPYHSFYLGSLLKEFPKLFYSIFPTLQQYIMCPQTTSGAWRSPQYIYLRRGWRILGVSCQFFLIFKGCHSDKTIDAPAILLMQVLVLPSGIILRWHGTLFILPFNVNTFPNSQAGPGGASLSLKMLSAYLT